MNKNISYRLKTAWFPAIALGFLIGNVQAADNKKFISKVLVDTIIQQAFVNLNSVPENLPGSDSKRRQVVADAKKVSAKLRTMGRGDPNERYIIWKTGELENQILLEERDLVLRKLEKDQKVKNAIIDVFNTELGKKRPDFVILKKTDEDMAAMDHYKAEEMQWSTEQRSVNISREIVYTLEKALVIGDLEKTQREFDYCKKNLPLLKITQEKFNRFEARITSLSEAIKLKPLIDEKFTIVHDCLPKNSLGEAGKTLREIEGMLSRIEHDLPQRDREEYSANVKKIQSMINGKEDSLVAITYAILTHHDENSALDHLEHVLKPCGVSELKVGQVHTSIMNVVTLKNKSDESGKLFKEKAFSHDDDQNGIDFSLVREAAKKKAQERADSVRAAEEKTARLLWTEKARSDSMRQALERVADLALRENRDKAQGITVQIYTFLENGKSAEALKLFTANEKALAQFLLKDAFSLLKSTISQPVQPIGAQNRAHDATREESAQDLKRNQEKAGKVTTEIYSMLEANNIEAAYKRFNEVRRPLEKYLCSEVFSMLETTVMQSYNSFLKDRK
jgi:hypothetical protein